VTQGTQVMLYLPNIDVKAFENYKQTDFFLANDWQHL